MNEYIKSIGEWLKDRYTNRFFFTFFIFYLASNYKIIIAFLFISDFKYNEFINIISLVWWEHLVHLFGAAGAAFLFLFVMPYASLFVQRIQSKPISEYRNRQYLENQQYLASKENTEKSIKNVLMLERENKLLLKENKSDMDYVNYISLTNLLTETELNKFFENQPHFGKEIDYSFLDKLKAFIRTANTAQFDFENIEMEEKKKKLFFEVGELVKTLDSKTMNKRDQAKNVMNLEHRVLKAYKEFYRLGRTLSA